MFVIGAIVVVARVWRQEPVGTGESNLWLLRLGRTGLAERYFRGALDRDPHYAYSYLELGALAVNAGRRSEGLRLLASAVALEPRDVVAKRALRQARRGRRIDIARMNEALRQRTIRLGR